MSAYRFPPALWDPAGVDRGLEVGPAAPAFPALAGGLGGTWPDRLWSRPDFALDGGGRRRRLMGPPPAADCSTGLSLRTGPQIGHHQGSHRVCRRCFTCHDETGWRQEPDAVDEINSVIA